MKKIIKCLLATAPAISALTAVTASADVIVEPYTFGDNSGVLPGWAEPTLAVIGAAALAAIIAAVIRKIKK